MGRLGQSGSLDERQGEQGSKQVDQEPVGVEPEWAAALPAESAAGPTWYDQVGPSRATLVSDSEVLPQRLPRLHGDGVPSDVVTVGGVDDERGDAVLEVAAVAVHRDVVRIDRRDDVERAERAIR